VLSSDVFLCIFTLHFAGICQYAIIFQGGTIQLNHIEYYLERKDILESDIKRIKSMLESMPAGTLVFSKQIKNGKPYYSWYKQMIEDGHKTRSFLPKKGGLDEAKALAQKMFYSKLLHDRYNELQCVNYYIRHRTAEKYSSLIMDDSPYAKLIRDSNTTSQEWEYSVYNKSSDHPEHLIIPAPKGDFVRSKSEAMIAQALFAHQIPYHYEEIHNIDGYPIATDFTVMHPVTRKTKLWEHLGLSDSSNYQQIIEFKLIHYLKDGYLPGHDLILTFENKAHPFSYLDAEELVKRYFL
jgi:hypothetical protein